MMERGKCGPHRPFSDRMPEVPGTGTRRILFFHSRRLHRQSSCRPRRHVDTEFWAGQSRLKGTVLLWCMRSKDIAAKLSLISSATICESSWQFVNLRRVADAGEGTSCESRPVLRIVDSGYPVQNVPRTIPTRGALTPCTCSFTRSDATSCCWPSYVSFCMSACRRRSLLLPGSWNDVPSDRPRHNDDDTTRI
ncbi:hypothetical protein K466DRAFT_409693 [Polyporus arcularius HHB13444]|uniref:Uncharacterized protein n=1 Tax=Polyporus arcularius HHB13444 TaxID=1314778 RepID=A0A5C3PV63_9APHY|nr:hypothetical protein K466DRAFT_409693 [Polyporus arcularius HHB13444]